MEARGLLLFGLVLLASGCGKSLREAGAGEGGSPSGTSGAGGAGGTGGNVVVLPGGAAGGGGDAENAGGFAGDDPDLSPCETLDPRLNLSGDLPDGFGQSLTLRAGCADMTGGDHPWPISYSVLPFENPGIEHRVLACNADESLRVFLTFFFTSSKTTGRATFDVDARRVHDTAMSSFEARERPFVSWPYPEAESDGVGRLFSGTMELPGASGGEETMTASFAVCHVRNVLRD